MSARVLAVMFFIGLIYFWNWIGKHFTDAPAQAVLGLGPTFVGMILFMIVFYGGWAVLLGLRWLVKG
jgi:hypothetical protein